MSPDGTLLGSKEPDRASVNFGQLEATHFQNNCRLVSSGDNIFLKGLNSGPRITGAFGEDGFPLIRGNTLEHANADLSKELAAPRMPR